MVDRRASISCPPDGPAQPNEVVATQDLGPVSSYKLYRSLVRILYSLLRASLLIDHRR